RSRARSPCNGGGMDGGRLAQPPEPSQSLEGVEVKSRLEELPRQLPAPGPGGVQRLVLDAAEVGRELDPLLVEGADARAPELGDGDPQLEERVRARARAETARLRGEPADVVAGEEDDRECERSLRLELLDQGAPAGRLLVEDDRLQSEPQQEACDLLPQLAVPSVDDPDLPVLRHLGRPGGFRKGSTRTFRKSETTGGRAQLAHLFPEIVEELGGLPAGGRAPQDGASYPLVGREQEPQEPFRLVVPPDVLL